MNIAAIEIYPFEYKRDYQKLLVGGESIRVNRNILVRAHQAGQCCGSPA